MPQTEKEIPTIKLKYSDMPLVFALINTDRVWLDLMSDFASFDKEEYVCGSGMPISYFRLSYAYKEFDGSISFSLFDDTLLTPTILKEVYLEGGLAGCYATLCKYDSGLRVCPTLNVDDYAEWDLDALLASYFNGYIFFTGYNPDIGEWDDDWHPAILCSDTFCYAADGENFKATDLKLISDLYAEFGYAGVTAWVAHKRKQEPLAKYITEDYERAKDRLMAQ